MENILNISRNISFYITLDRKKVELIINGLRYLLTDSKYQNTNLQQERKSIDEMIRIFESELKKK